MPESSQGCHPSEIPERGDDVVVGLREDEITPGVYRIRWSGDGEDEGGEEDVRVELDEANDYGGGLIVFYENLAGCYDYLGDLYSYSYATFLRRISDLPAEVDA